MIRRVIWTAIAAIAGVGLLYISRFWVFQLWGREGLFGIEALRPQGGLLAQWLGGTDFADFELVIWVVLSFLTLTLLQKLYDLTSGGNHD
ncbi:MAG: hypothetical protein AAFN80_17970 [Pseudomonadota bacterium]